MVEELVKLLICVVDAQLLKRVEMKVLKAKDVENADEASRVFSRIGTFVNVIDEPGKSSRVQSFGHRMSIFFCLVEFEWNFRNIAYK